MQCQAGLPNRAFEGVALRNILIIILLILATYTTIVTKITKEGITR
jgi:hypothetical protein